MEKIEILNFTHGNTGRPVCVIKQQIFSFFIGAQEVVYIMGPAGALIPVKESIQDVTQKLTNNKE